MRNLDLQGIYQTRRANYQYTAAALKGTRHLRPLFDELPEGICPLGYPLVAQVDNSRIEDLLSDYPLLYLWWSNSYPTISLKPFPESNWLKKRCFFIPIHQDMEIKHLDYLIDYVLTADKEMC
jgi:dTDP-4-amino-4,6-dideoxygalactose transaminase